MDVLRGYRDAASKLLGVEDLHNSVSFCNGLRQVGVLSFVLR